MILKKGVIIDSDPLSKDWSIKVHEQTEEYSLVSVEIQPRMLNPLGGVHGGVLASLIDVAGGVASHANNKKSMTLDMQVQYIKAARDCSMLTAEARSIRLGRTIMVYAISIKDQNGGQVCTGTITYYVLNEDQLKAYGQKV